MDQREYLDTIDELVRKNIRLRLEVRRLSRDMPEPKGVTISDFAAALDAMSDGNRGRAAGLIRRLTGRPHLRDVLDVMRRFEVRRAALNLDDIFRAAFEDGESK